MTHGIQNTKEPIMATKASNSARHTQHRPLTLDEVDAVSGGATSTSRGLAPDPHTPDIVQIILAIIRKLS